MFKPKGHPVPGGTIYTLFGKEPLFVPESKALNAKEAQDLKDRLENARETVALLQEAVRAMLPLNRGLAHLNYEVNAISPMDEHLDYRVQGLLEVLRRTGYLQTTTENGYLRSVIQLPEKVAEILEELGDTHD